jgi:hypothetical protein
VSCSSTSSAPLFAALFFRLDDLVHLSAAMIVLVENDGGLPFEG